MVDIDAILAGIPEWVDPDPPHPSECALWHLTADHTDD